MAGAPIRDHHRRAIDRLVETYRDDPEFRGLIIGGSVAKGFARDDSDVDFLIIATDESFERRLAARDLFINRTDLCDYEHGFVDGKIINLAYLEDLAERGNEPSRAAFQGAFAAYSHIPDLDALLTYLAGKGVSPTYEPTIRSLAPYGKVRITAIRSPEGAMLEFFEELED